MPLDIGELDRLADDTYKNRVITGFIYCGHCGYNLHSLPYVYTCPECGQQYNARPLVMKGIFSPHNAQLPVSEIAGMLLCLTVAVGLIWSGVKGSGTVRIIAGAAIGILGITLGSKAYQRTMQYFKTMGIARRIEAED